MSLSYEKKLIGKAKNLRNNATPQENRLWYCFLRDYPVRFQRQKTIGNYIADFYCHKARLVIEIDGSQHYEPQARERDAQRTAILERAGLKILRYSNREINLEFQAVCRQIDFNVKKRSGEQSDDF